MCEGRPDDERAALVGCGRPSHATCTPPSPCVGRLSALAHEPERWEAVLRALGMIPSTQGGHSGRVPLSGLLSALESNSLRLVAELLWEQSPHRLFGREFVGLLLPSRHRRPPMNNMNLSDLIDCFGDEVRFRTYLEELRWPEIFFNDTSTTEKV